MPKAETDLFIKHLNKTANASFYEFGSGGSTYLACSLKGISTIWSMESDTAFFNTMMKEPVIQEAIHKGKLTYVLTDVNSHNNWGNPAKGILKSQWSPYFSHIDNLSQIPTILLIDGRFRVACALHAYNRINEHTCVLFDDFNDRPHYHSVLKYYNIIETAGRIVVLQKKSGMSIDSVDLDLYESDCR